ncbi:hypothetical protein SOVF_178470 [Spinacia oleracea]|nr:hypothetical protein SOVF_178470 [Spinacia oleracea]
MQKKYWFTGNPYYSDMSDFSCPLAMVFYAAIYGPHHEIVYCLMHLTPFVHT